MGTYVTRGQLSTSVSKTTLKRLRRLSRESGLSMSVLIDTFTAEGYARFMQTDRGERGKMLLSRIVDLNMEKRRLEGSKLASETQPAETHEAASEAQ